MPSTPSPSLKLELIANGEQAGVWGITTNVNLGTLLEQAICGYQSVTMTNADYTLTTSQYVANESRNAVINMIGTLTAIRSVIAPAVPKVYFVKNSTTGGFAINFKRVGSSGGVSIPNGKTVILFYNGSEFEQLISYYAETATYAVTAGTAAACSGNSATATYATTAGTFIGDQTNWASYRASAVANMLGWKNFSNGHVIFDASASTSPTGSAVNNANSTTPWSATLPTLMGWNGSQTFGVRVDSARSADTATIGNTLAQNGTGGGMTFNWSGQSGQPTSLWGSSDPTGLLSYVYNPSNFSVNYATSSGTSGSCSGNAATATTATYQSGGSINATTGAFSGTASFPSVAGSFEIKMGTGDGASSTVYNTTIRSWWGIGFRDYTNSTTVKAYIDTRTGLISSCGGGSQDETRLYSNGTTSEIRFGGTTTTNGAARITYDRSNAAFEFFTGTAATPARRMALTNVGMYVDYLAGTGVRTVTASAGGLLSTSSDSRLKTEVFTPLPSLAEVLQLKTHAFKWNEDIDYRGDEAAVEIGFFANETVNVIPSSAPMNADGYYGFFDRPIVAALVNAVKEQNALITALTARVTALET